jgi:hypothetical protein
MKKSIGGFKMKKILLIILAILMFAGIIQSAYAVGTATVTPRYIYEAGQVRRTILTVSWTDDTNGTTYVINPTSYNIMGWYLYSAETNPGSGPPTDNYDITLVDADTYDLAGGLLMNRDTSTTEMVNMGNAPASYPMITDNFTFTLSGNSVNNATGTLILLFTTH